MLGSGFKTDHEIRYTAASTPSGGQALTIQVESRWDPVQTNCGNWVSEPEALAGVGGASGIGEDVSEGGWSHHGLCLSVLGSGQKTQPRSLASRACAVSTVLCCLVSEMLLWNKIRFSNSLQTT